MMHEVHFPGSRLFALMASSRGTNLEAGVLCLGFLRAGDEYPVLLLLAKRVSGVPMKLAML